MSVASPTKMTATRCPKADNSVNAAMSGRLRSIAQAIPRSPCGRRYTLTIDRLVERRTDFAWESTLSGLAHIKRLQAMKRLEYHVEIIYLRLASPRLALRRIVARVRQGGHNVPKAAVLRRFSRSWENFKTRYRPLADAWAVYDNSSRPPELIESGP